MKREFITRYQGVNLIILFTAGSTLVLGTGAEAGKDSWISILLATAVMIPVIIMYITILTSYPGMDLFQVIEHVFGRAIGLLLNIIYIFFAATLSGFIIRNFGEFVKSVSLNETPINVILLFVSIVVIYGLKGGIEVLGRWSGLIGPILIILTISTMVMLIPNSDLNNLRPIMFRGINPIIEGSFFVISFPMAELVIFMMGFSSLKNKREIWNVYLKGFFIGAIMIFMATIMEIIVLGENTYSAAAFPSYSAVRRIDFGNFVQRVEIIMATTFFCGGFIKSSMCCLGACKGISQVFKFEDYRFLVTPIGIIIFILAAVSFNDISEMSSFVLEVWRYYSIVFQVFIPVIILVGVVLKKGMDKKRS